MECDLDPMFYVQTPQSIVIENRCRVVQLSRVVRNPASISVEEVEYQRQVNEENYPAECNDTQKKEREFYTVLWQKDFVESACSVDWVLKIMREVIQDNQSPADHGD